MANFERKPNTGAIFKNDKKQGSQPDYRGTIDVDGKEKEISLWVKEGKKGKFFSVSIGEPYKKKEYINERIETGDVGGSDLPF
jgi:hypothetical protein